MTTQTISPPLDTASRSPKPSIDDLDVAIRRLARLINVESYQMLLLVREFDERLGWAKWSFRGCAEWLAWRCGMSLSAAREKVRTAHALRDLPKISAAFADGRLSYTKVRALTRVASTCNEDLLMAYALDATAPQIEERCRQMRNVQPESISVSQRAWERRSLSVWRHPERGTLSIRVEVPIEDGEVIAKALDRAIEAGEAAKGAEFADTSWPMQQADALVAVAKTYLSGGVGDASSSGEEKVSTSGATADHYQVVIHTDEAALRGGAGRADLPVETLRRLTCDGSVIAVVEDDKGTPLNVGRKQRTVTTALKRAVHARDRGCCTFPGCHNTRFLDTHHIEHWIDGGETSLANLTLLCTHHHRLLHEGRYRIRQDLDRDGAICFQRPDGRVIPRDGYRLDDVLDDALEDASVEGSSSAAAWLAALVNRRPLTAAVPLRGGA